MKEALKIGVSGVRGVVGDSFTPQLAASFAQAFGALVGVGPVVVGRDTRPSGRMAELAVMAGLQSVGCKPILTGIAPTPTILLLTRALGARGGIAITASHNPAAWNALKFAGRNGLFLDEARVEELLDIYHQQDFPLVSEPELLAATSEPEPMRRHIERIAAYVDLAAVRAKRFRVAVDMCNGVGALYSVPFLEQDLGCEVVPVHGRPSGVFERGPEPLPENLGALCAAVVDHGCAIGFAQDPDGDRLALVDENGNPLGEDMTLALAVAQVLDAHERGPVVVNLATSKSVDAIARDRGVVLERTRIGEINVVQAMLKGGSVVGGENNGGVIVPRMHPCRDSFMAMALVLERMAQAGKPLSALRDDFPRYVMVKDKLPVRGERAPELLRRLRRSYEGERVNTLDGIFVEWPDRWAHARRSNTESVIRIGAEAPDEAGARALLAEMRERLIKIESEV